MPSTTYAEKIPRKICSQHPSDPNQPLAADRIAQAQQPHYCSLGPGTGEDSRKRKRLLDGRLRPTT
jgi:hypothetical protein